MNKKTDEKKILERFKEASCWDLSILDTEDAKKHFPQYNDENPDFIANFNNKFIGIELFRLCLTQSEEKVEYGGRQFKNYMQKESVYPNLITSLEQGEELFKEIGTNHEKYPLLGQDNISSILRERISQKMKTLHNYVTTDNWLFGYAVEECNMDMIPEIYEDNIQEKIKDIIKDIIKQNDGSVTNKVSRVILFEPDSSKETCLCVDMD